MTLSAVHDHAAGTRAPTPGALRLSDEIAFLEDRLTEMGYAGDCAYEHALSRAYAERLHERRRELASLAY